MVVWHILKTARGVIISPCQNVHLISQQKAAVTREKIVTILERLYRLGLGENDGGVVDEKESTRRDVLLSSVIYFVSPSILC